jgi:hypothetical protein
MPSRHACPCLIGNTIHVLCSRTPHPVSTSSADTLPPMVGKMGVHASHRRFYVWWVLHGFNRHGKIAQMKGERDYMAKSVIRGSISLLTLDQEFTSHRLHQSGLDQYPSSFFLLPQTTPLDACIQRWCTSSSNTATPARHHVLRGTTHHCCQ